MGQASTDVIAGAAEGDLCLVLQTPESAAVDDAFAISLEFRAKIMGLFGMFATQTFFAFGGIAGKESGFFLLPVLSGSDRHSSGMKMRDGKSREGEIFKEQGVKKTRMVRNNFLSWL